MKKLLLILLFSLPIYAQVEFQFNDELTTADPSNTHSFPMKHEVLTIELTSIAVGDTVKIYGSSDWASYFRCGVKPYLDGYVFTSEITGVSVTSLTDTRTYLIFAPRGSIIKVVKSSSAVSTITYKLASY